MSKKGEYEARIQTVCLATLTIIAVAVALYLLRIVLVPFILAAFLSLLLVPVVEFMMRKLRINRPIALLFTFLGGSLIVIAIAAFVSVSVGQFANSASIYEAQISRLLSDAENSGPFKALLYLAGAPVPTRPIQVDGDSGAGEPAGTFHASQLLPEGTINGLARRLSWASCPPVEWLPGSAVHGLSPDGKHDTTSRRKRHHRRNRKARQEVHRHQAPFLNAHRLSCVSRAAISRGALCHVLRGLRLYPKFHPQPRVSQSPPCSPCLSCCSHPMSAWLRWPWRFSCPL